MLESPHPGRRASLPLMMDVLAALREGLAPHYAVEREIGAGGMARVYLAHERHPPRAVAVKVMAPELSSPAFRERFIREVELTSKLSHPHIVPILAADECLFVPDGPDGLCYYIMPYIAGESLRVRLAREQTLPLEDALHITFQVADALGYAHGHGVIHRDVKPENILLSEDQAFVADFGIARAISAAGAAAGGTLTGAGQPVGSLAYMSPEQLMGSRAIDARTDLYSLGCVLYEMLVGQPPLLDLAGQSAPAPATLEAVLRRRGVSGGTARRLREVMSRALASSAPDRFAAAEDLIAALRDVGVGRPARGLRGLRGLRLPRISRRAALVGGGAVVVLGALGVMPLTRRRPALDPRRVVVAGFEDLSGDPRLAPLGHIAADWITQALAQSGGVEVVPSAATRHLDAADVRALAAQTGAGTVVWGTYYREGDSVRFQLQVIDAQRGTVRRALDVVSAPQGTPVRAADALRRRVAALFDTLFARSPD